MRVLDLLCMGVTLYVVWFCKICVAVFAFISGYGICSSVTKIYEQNANKVKAVIGIYCLERLLRFMSKYWLCFVTFVPIGLVLRKIYFEPSVFIRSLLGIDSTYNLSWWYVKQYILMVLFAPILLIPLCTFSRKSIAAILRVIIGLMIWIGAVSALGGSLTYSLIFIEGVIVQKSKLFDRFYIRKTFCATVVLFIIFVFKSAISQKSDMIKLDVIAIMLFMLSVRTLLNHSQKVTSLFEWIAKYSTYMWLTHMFFSYYYFQSLVILTNISTLIYIELVSLTLLVSAVLNHVECIVLSSFKRIRAK